MTFSFGNLAGAAFGTKFSHERCTRRETCAVAAFGVIVVSETLTLSFGFANFIIIIIIVIGISVLRPVVGQAAGIPCTWGPTGWHTTGGLVVLIFARTMAIIVPGRWRRFRHLSLHFLNPAIRLYSRSHCYSLVDCVSCYDCHCRLCMCVCVFGEESKRTYVLLTNSLKVSLNRQIWKSYMYCLYDVLSCSIARCRLCLTTFPVFS